MAIDKNLIPPIIKRWHRNVLLTAAIFTVLLIALGGILCVTQSIRSCPDWPGCFGKVLPPLEVSPILEITHRFFAAISGALILGAAITGIARARKQPWLFFLPLIALLLAVEVSYFGARVVLYGLSPGWAAVDLGSALLVVACMVTSAIISSVLYREPERSIALKFQNAFARLVLVTTVVIYGVLVSGVLIAGENSLSGCLGWPIYNPSLSGLDLPGVGKGLRLAFSVIGIGLILVVMVKSWLMRQQHPATFRVVRWIAILFVFFLVLQILLLLIGREIALLIPYTVLSAVFWGLWVAVFVLTGLEENQVLIRSHPGSSHQRL